MWRMHLRKIPSVSSSPRLPTYARYLPVARRIRFDKFVPPVEELEQLCIAAPRLEYMEFSGVSVTDKVFRTLFFGIARVPPATPLPLRELAISASTVSSASLVCLLAASPNLEKLDLLSLY